MVEKKQLTKEMLDKGFNEAGFKVVETPLPYSDVESAALELMNLAVIIDPIGVVYEDYSYDLEYTYIILKYFTDLDTENWDKETLYQFVGLAFYDIKVNVNIFRFDDMIYRMRKMVEKRTARENSLDYKLGKLVDAYINMNLEEAQNNTEKIIRMINKEERPELTMFAKKNDRQ